MNIRRKKGDKKKSAWTDILFVYFSILFVWTVYRMMIFLPEWVDEFIAKPILWMGPILIIQGKRLYVLSLQRFNKKNMSYNIKLGLFIGIGYFATYTLFSSIPSGFPSLNPDHFSFLQIILQGAIALSTGYIEELVFRRYLLEKAISIFNDSMLANTFTAILFAFIHLPIILFVYKYELPQIISYLALLTLSGFVYGLVYLKNKSLSAATMTHAVWNFLGTVIR